MADLFESALNLEEQFQQEGYEEGRRHAHMMQLAVIKACTVCVQPCSTQRGPRHAAAAAMPPLPPQACCPQAAYITTPSCCRDGRRSGHAEGRALGLQKGFEVGHEVGYYAGCTQLWRQLQQRDPQLFRCALPAVLHG